MIRFSALCPITAPFRISPPLRMFLLISTRIPLSAPIPNYNIRVRVRINRGSSSFNCSQRNRNATLQKQWSSSEFLNYYFHMSS